jgi:hypothetical protein
MIYLFESLVIFEAGFSHLHIDKATDMPIWCAIVHLGAQSTWLSIEPQKDYQ